MSRRFQFSIRFVLLATVAVAAGAAAARAEPSALAALTIDSLTVLYFTGTIVGIVRTRGGLRSFWVGASIVLGVAVSLASTSLWIMIMYGDDATMPMIGVYPTPHRLAVVWCAAPINGLFAAFVHWLFSPKQKPSA